MSGQSLGPVLGGIIAQFLGFHAIFWFLFIFGSITLIFIVLFLPETLRSIAGNGTIKLTGIHRPLIYSFKPPRDEVIDRNTPLKKKITLATIFFPFKALKEKDVFIILIVGATHYTVWSMVTSSTTALFEKPFNLNLLQLGLIFLPNGIGSTLGSLLTGKQSSREWDDAERAYRKEKNIPESIPLNKKELIDFPFEKARMGNMWWMVLMFVVSTGLYGYSLRLNDIVVPLALQFLIAYAQASIFNINQTLIVDLYPEASASASAINNLVRCLLGAGGVAIIQPMINAVGAGPSFVILACITAAVSLLLILEWFKGEGWRRARKERLAAEKQMKLEADAGKVLFRDEKK
jgi:predicted MFS family arabinose efflux permease